MLRHVRLTTLVALFVVIPAVAVAAAPFAYVSNSGSASFSAIDLGVNPNIVTTTPLPGSILPWGVALNPAGTRLYVTNLGNGSVYVVDTTTTPPTVYPPVVVRRQPVAVAVNPSGTRVYVSHMRIGTGFAGGVTVIDAGTNTVMSEVTVGLLNEGITVHPDGSRVYLASSNGVLVLDAAKLEARTVDILGTITIGSRPFGLVLNASGSQLYVTNNGSGTVSAVNTATMMAEGEGFVGVEPIGIALSPDETRVYVANNKSGSVSVLNAATLLPAAPDIIVGGAPYGLDVAGDGRIFVANSAIGSTSMWVIDPGSLTVSTRTVGSSPVAFGRFIHRPAFVETMLQLSVAPESVIFGSAGPLTFTATLTRKDNGAPVSGGSVAFMVDGASVGNATTNAAGAATLAYNPSALLVGTHTARAAFSESAINGLTHKASDASQAFSVRYQFTWRSPSNGGSVNTANAGSTIPLRWSMTDANGNAIANAEFSITSAPCPSAAAVGPTGKVAARFAGNSDLRYDASTNQYVFNWKTQREWAGTCRQLFVDPKDGSLHSLTFQFR